MPEGVYGGAGVVPGALCCACVEGLPAEELGPPRVAVPLGPAASPRADQVQVEAALVCNASVRYGNVVFYNNTIVCKVTMVIVPVRKSK